MPELLRKVAEISNAQTLILEEIRDIKVAIRGLNSQPPVARCDAVPANPEAVEGLPLGTIEDVELLENSLETQDFNDKYLLSLHIE